MHRTEWQIYAAEERLAGSIDFTAMNDLGDLTIIDWKRSKAFAHHEEQGVYRWAGDQGGRRGL